VKVSKYFPETGIICQAGRGSVAEVVRTNCVRKNTWGNCSGKGEDTEGGNEEPKKASNEKKNPGQNSPELGRSKKICHMSSSIKKKKRGSRGEVEH